MTRDLLRLARRAARVPRLILAVLAVLPLVGSCYVPDDFLAEIRLARNGDYALVYKGKLIWVPLWEDIRQGKLSPEEIREKTEIVRRDLARDANFKTVTPLGQGQFEVFYERYGRFTSTRKVTFVRRGAEILSMELRTNGELHIRSRNDPKLDMGNQLAAHGLKSRGRFRIVTNTAVVLHNAQEVSSGLPGYPDYRVYDWTIDSGRRPPPLFIGRL